jgi:large subunit ribosomal protein L2
MVVEYVGGDLALLPAVEGIRVGQSISMGEKVPIESGNTIRIKDVPAGTIVSNVERVPGDGGKLVRTSGMFAQVIGKEKKGIAVRLPSKRKIVVHKNCFVTIGTVAGGGRTNKPFVKAGNKFHAMKARGIRYPIVRGKAMNATDHPHGNSHTTNAIGGGKYSTTRPRNLPPGKKVGQIAAKRTGKKK